MSSMQDKEEKCSSKNNTDISLSYLTSKNIPQVKNEDVDPINLHITVNKEQIQEKNEYLSDLNSKFTILKIYICSCFVVVVIDIILMIFFPNGFFNGYNIFCLFLISLSLSGCLYLFKKQFQNINRFVYKSTAKMLYGISIIILLYYIDLIYVILFKFFLNPAVSFDTEFIFLPIIMMMLYAGLNFTFPVLVIFQIIQIRHVIKDIGYCEGQNYSLSEISSSFSLPQSDNIPTNKPENNI